MTLATGSRLAKWIGRDGRAGARYGCCDVSPDGQRFLMVKGSEPENATSRINVVLNWFDELGRSAGPAIGR